METEPLRILWRLAFGDPTEWIDCFFSTAYAPERCRFLTSAGRVTAALYWLDGFCGGQKLAYLYAIATHPDFRGRGLCRTLMADTHTLLAQQGYSGTLLLPAGEGLRQMYRKMGYETCCHISEFSCTAAAPVPLRPVDASEYAHLRRSFLPRHGVLQEGEALAFLSTFAQTYAGKDFLLAAVSDETGFHGLELLGNQDAAPGILAALGHAEGIFRVPGNDLPFAMFRPLTPDAEAPEYFGLAVD